jgi:hypothetical protein
MNSWLFQGNPKFYLVRPALHHFNSVSRPTTWLVNKHEKHIRSGDEVFFWEAGSEAGLVGWGSIETDPAKLQLESEELRFVKEQAKFEGLRPRVRIIIRKELYYPRRDLLRQPSLSKWYVIAHGQTGTNFRIPSDVLLGLRKLVEQPVNR